MITIERVANGFIMHYDDDETKETYIYPETYLGARELLIDIRDAIGMAGSRYDDKRIYVTVEPGDKYEAPPIPESDPALEEHGK